MSNSVTTPNAAASDGFRTVTPSPASPSPLRAQTLFMQTGDRQQPLTTHPTPSPPSAVLSGPARAGGFGCSWRCSLKHMELESALSQLRAVHAESQSAHAAMQQRYESQLSMAAAAEAQAEAQLEDLRDRLAAKDRDVEVFQRRTEQCLKLLADKEEEIIGNDQHSSAFGAPCLERVPLCPYYMRHFHTLPSSCRPADPASRAACRRSRCPLAARRSSHRGFRLSSDPVDVAPRTNHSSRCWSSGFGGRHPRRSS